MLGLSSNVLFERYGSKNQHERPRWEEDLCCDEGLEPLGSLFWLGEDGDTDQRNESSILFFMGPYSRLWCYSVEEDATYLAARDLDELGRRGILHLECLYSARLLPVIATGPSVARLLEAAEDRKDDLSTSAACCAARRVSKAAYDCRYESVSLHTPGERERALYLCGGARGLLTCWPFMSMGDPAFCDLAVFWTQRLCCAWWVLGAVGDYLPTGLFHAETVILMDVFGVMYAFDVATASLYRVAKNLRTFFSCGLLITFYPDRRFQTRRRCAERLDARPSCPHREGNVWDGYSRALDFSNVRNYEGLYNWLMREDRFRHDIRSRVAPPWYERDAYSCITSTEQEIETRAIASPDAGATRRKRYFPIRSRQCDDDSETDNDIEEDDAFSFWSHCRDSGSNNEHRRLVIRRRARPRSNDWPKCDAQLSAQVRREKQKLLYTDARQCMYEHDWNPAEEPDERCVMLRRAARERLSDLGYTIRAPWIPLGADSGLPCRPDRQCECESSDEDNREPDLDPRYFCCRRACRQSRTMSICKPVAIAATVPSLHEEESKTGVEVHRVCEDDDGDRGVDVLEYGFEEHLYSSCYVGEPGITWPIDVDDDIDDCDGDKDDDGRGRSEGEDSESFAWRSDSKDCGDGGFFVVDETKA